MKELASKSLATMSLLGETTKDFFQGIERHKKFILAWRPELQTVLWSYMKERVDSTGKWRHPNLLVPYFFNELFRLADTQKIETICAAYLACDHFTHLLDDLADEKNRHDQALLAHASHLMLSHGRKLYLDMASDPNGFLDFFEKYLEGAMRGEQWLWKRHLNTAAYSHEDLEMLRARGGMLNICLVAYCDATDQWHLWKKLEHVLGGIVVGIQLLDDAVDVKHDFNNDIYTMPLATAIHDLKEVPLSWENVAARLLKGSGWKNTITLALSYLNQGITALDELKLPSLSTALRRMANDANELLAVIEQTDKDKDFNAAEKMDKILRMPIIRNLSH